MTPKKYKEFKQWYDKYVETQNDIFVDDNQFWEFNKEFNKYCMLDVDVLAQAVLKFRDIFMKLDVDPWRYVTLPSLCKDMYINK
jgi:hypothetical protein